MGSTLFSALSAKIFGGLAVALALALAWQTMQLSGARKANDLLDAQRSAAVADKRLCSASIDGFKAVADERKKRADDAVAIAKKQSVIHVNRAADILKIPVPTPDKECAATLQLLKDHQ